MSDLAVRRAEALFCSPLQPSMDPIGLDVRILITGSQARYSEIEIAARMAQEFGDHPDLAAARMWWCLAAVAHAYETATV